MTKSYVLRELDGSGTKLATHQTAAIEEICSTVVTDTENNALVGQKAMAASLPVTIASDQPVADVDVTGQGDVPVTLDGETVDVADRAVRDLGKVDVAGMDTVGGVAGQAVMAASLPMVIASDQSAIAADVTGQGDLPTKPFDGIQEGGLTELIGSTEQVDAADYGGSIGVALGATHSGELLMVTLYTSEIGTGAVLEPDGTLYVFDADPTIAAGDLAMSAAERETSLGHIDIGTDEWVADANGAQCSKKLYPLLFHPLSTLYFVWFNGAVPFNDDAGVAKFEILKFNFWYRRDS